ncbi:histone deacetylase 6-like [Paramacrobiotus metropolitanus]|uniref:histone deacetylase 6-like n=1 Tax=Paramacrobiotus metropolitanus TaxID=2943436 RepID=UPI002445B092|nr:histone deacetylase 6-like [Paramacrobiotus metropolitanus]
MRRYTFPTAIGRRPPSFFRRATSRAPQSSLVGLGYIFISDMQAEQGASSSNGGDPGSTDSDQIKFYGVIPKPWCEHLEGNIKPVSDAGIDAAANCSVCEDARENWVCLHCYKVFCSRYVNGHMKDHNETSGHTIALSVADLSVWCFACDCYIHNALAQPAKEAAYKSKFGEDDLVSNEGNLEPER